LYEDVNCIFEFYDDQKNLRKDRKDVKKEEKKIMRKELRLKRRERTVEGGNIKKKNPST